jgi:hypothetical protein
VFVVFNADPPGFDFADTASDLLMECPHDLDPSMRGHSGQEAEMTSEMMESFPSLSYRMLAEISGLSSHSNQSGHGEGAYLRDSLEKERYRRRHCEQQIQALNVKVPPVFCLLFYHLYNQYGIVIDINIILDIIITVVIIIIIMIIIVIIIVVNRHFVINVIILSLSLSSSSFSSFIIFIKIASS